jgi:hypothetical protein
MATTTNYGWDTPDDTDLVKDGAAAIRTLGSSIDTTVFTNASAGIAKTIVDAKGDLIAATASDTVDRLGVGTNGQLLAADSTAATGLAWVAPPSSGGMTSLASGSLSGSSITLSSINQTYNSLVLRIIKPTVSASFGELLVRVNNVSTADQSNTLMRSNGTTILNNNGLSGYSANRYDTSTTSANSFIEYTFPSYATTSMIKMALVYVANQNNNATSGISVRMGDTAAITSLVILDANSNTFNAGTYVLYGVK